MEGYFFYFLVIFFLVIFGWLIFLTAKIFKMSKRAEILFSEEPKGNLGQVLEGYLKSVKEVENHCFTLDNDLGKVTKTASLGLQKSGFVRYNPFGDVGGNQSFSLCLLDKGNNGFVISSIHSREGTRVYAKTVKNGESQYNLSEEEKQAILGAVGLKNNNKKENPERIK